jgi:hypothetical protein
LKKSDTSAEDHRPPWRVQREGETHRALGEGEVGVEGGEEGPDLVRDRGGRGQGEQGSGGKARGRRVRGGAPVDEEGDQTGGVWSCCRGCVQERSGERECVLVVGVVCLGVVVSVSAGN